MKRLGIDIINYCNLNCAGCNHFSPLVKEKKMLSIDKFIQLMEKMDSLKLLQYFNEICLVGGEPTLHPDLDKIISVIQSYHINPHVLTNTNRTDNIFESSCYSKDKSFMYGFISDTKSEKYFCSLKKKTNLF